MSDEIERTATEEATAAPKKAKRAAKPKAEKPEVDGTDEDEDGQDDYVAPRSRARQARADRLARIGGDV